MWWDDLAPPFSFPSTGKDIYGDNDSDTSEDNEGHATHFCFLVHGHRGFSNDLSYLRTAMEHFAVKENRKRWISMRSNTSSSFSTLSDNESLESAEDEWSSNISKMLPYDDLIVHSAVCNERRTKDGVENGGKRLVEEIISVIRQKMNESKSDIISNGENASSDIKDITLSIVGNSLGGIYGRYAIAELARICSTEDGLLLDGRYRIHFNVFCTTATPHLGISKHTYLPLPRTAEIGVANILGDTGKDLFRLNNLLRTMATTPQYLRPLACFRKRIAYANAYATDFAVPASTAAFLADDSDYPHHYLEEKIIRGRNNNDYDNDNYDDSNGDLSVDEEDKRRLFVATFRTPAKMRLNSLFDNDRESVCFDSLSPSASSNSEYDQDIDELLQMSNALDSLGWEKVFVDIRKEIPIRVRLPRKMNLKKRSNNTTINYLPNCESSDTMDVNDSEVYGGEEEYDTIPHIYQLKRKRVVESKDIISAISLPDDNKLSLPLGHNMIVAFSRSRISTLMNKGGRKVVDALAKEVVEDIYSWHPASAT